MLVSVAKIGFYAHLKWQLLNYRGQRGQRGQLLSRCFYWIHSTKNKIVLG